MTTAVGTHSGHGVPPDARAARHRRPDQRGRALEKALAAFVLFLAFAVTVVLLGLQWLGNQGTASSAGLGTGHSYVSEVQAS